MAHRHDFIIIGAAKCATTTLYAQLAAQPGIFMTDPKEPCFFSDDDRYAQGIEGYWDLYKGAQPGELRGEASTRYSYLPSHPQTVERMVQHLPPASSSEQPGLKLIYVMRHPMDRLVSDYIHEWTERTIAVELDEAIAQQTPLIDYGRYHYQLQPYFEAYGQANVLPVFFDRLITDSQAELERVCKFIGYDSAAPNTRPQWVEALSKQNISKERLQKAPLRDAIVNAPLLASLRRVLVPQWVRDRVKSRYRMEERPSPNPENAAHLTALFDEDLAQLGKLLGVELTCENFKAVTRVRALDWVAQTKGKDGAESLTSTVLTV